MFEERNNIDTDLLMRSILENGQEEVPAHVWEGVSAGLDAIARKKRIALWWKRSAVAGAVAAAVAAVLFLNPSGNDMDIVPMAVESDMIAVVTEVPAEEATAEAKLTAKAEAKITAKPDVKIAAKPEVTAEVETAAAEEAGNMLAEARPGRESGGKAEAILFPESWDEEETGKRKIRTSLVLAGLTGTNSAQHNAGKSLVKRPSLSNELMKTGIKETSTKSTYGIPVSFGAGVKIGLSPRWSISAGVNYSMFSRTFYGDYTKVTDGAVESSISSDIRNTQHYIGIPVNAYYNIMENENINFYVYAGGTAEKCITNKYSVLSTSIVHKELPDGLQFSANAGIGVEFMLGKHLGLYVDPSLRYYFDCNQPKSIRTVQPLTLGFEMGLRVNL